MSAEKATQEQDLPVDRGDDVTPPEPVLVELTGEDLAKIGKAPEKSEAAEPVKEDAKLEEPEKKEAEPEKKPIMIPKARFDEVNRKAKARIAELENRMKAMQERTEAAGAPPDVAALETELGTKSAEYGTLVADGKLEEATVVMKEINRINRKIGLVEAAALSNTHTQEVRHMDSLESLVGMFKETFPVFDETSTEYNQEYVNYVARLQGGFESANMSPAEALREAVEVAVMKFGLLGADAEPAKAEEKPNKGAERKAAAIDKALSAAGAQPQSMTKVGTDSDKIGMTKISIDDLTSMEAFMALPESTVKRLRGDLI